MLPTKTENPNGLHQRYGITHLDGSPIDPEADYFILRLDERCQDQKHIKSCRKAILTYADEIEYHLPQLADDIRIRYGGWFSEIPSMPGMYWFFGNLEAGHIISHFKDISTIKLELIMVQVYVDQGNSPMCIYHGDVSYNPIKFNKEKNQVGVYGIWKEATLPSLDFAHSMLEQKLLTPESEIESELSNDIPEDSYHDCYYTKEDSKTITVYEIIKLSNLQLKQKLIRVFPKDNPVGLVTLLNSIELKLQTYLNNTGEIDES